MEVEKPSQDLSTPMLHRPNVNPFVLLSIPITSLDTPQKRVKNLNHLHTEIAMRMEPEDTYCRRVPEVNISVTKLMFLLAVSTQEV